MTNGEKMQEVFSEGKTRRCKGGVVFESDGWCHAYHSDWWNTEYKEPTTKNNLASDRKDAVERLNALKQFIGYDKDSEIVKATQKSLDMAIKALEHPEKNVIAVVPCGDVISRADVLQILLDYDYANENALVLKDIKGLPSVTPQEPRKGHWVIKDKMWWVCSACGCQTRMMKKYNVPNFCPACGADMREVEE